MQAVDNVVASQIASEVSARINALEALFEDSLVNEMDDLKAVLIENPSAAALIMDEDVGILVRNLRRIVGEAVKDATAGKAKTKKSGSKKLSAEEIQAALDAEGF